MFNSWHEKVEGKYDRKEIYVFINTHKHITKM